MWAAIGWWLGICFGLTFLWCLLCEIARWANRP